MATKVDMCTPPSQRNRLSGFQFELLEIKAKIGMVDEHKKSL